MKKNAILVVVFAMLFACSSSEENNNVDESNFVIPDPVISQIVQSESYFNADFSMAYHKNGFFSYFTAKNIKRVFAYC